MNSLIRLAIQGVTNGGIRPLRAEVLAGGRSLAVSLLLIIVQLLYHGITWPVWSDWEILLIVGLFFGSIQLLILCLLGEYTQCDLDWSNKWDEKMNHIEKANTGIAVAIARLDDEDMVHFYSQKSTEIDRSGYPIPERCSCRARCGRRISTGTLYKKTTEKLERSQGIDPALAPERLKILFNH